MVYEECKTPYEYIKKTILINRGSESIIKRSELIRLCELLGEDFQKNDTKERLVDILTQSLGVQGFAEALYKDGLGVSSFEYQHKFDISGNEVKRMERLGFIHCVGFRKFRNYGKYLNAPVYDVFEFYALTPENVQKFLKLNPKGTRKTQVRYR